MLFSTVNDNHVIFRLVKANVFFSVDNKRFWLSIEPFELYVSRWLAATAVF